MSAPLSHLECIRCEKRYDARDVRYHCDCGDLLQVTHDLGRTRRQFGDLKTCFEERLVRPEGVDRSGVWRYREFVLPDLPTSAIISKPEGNTRLYRSAKLSRRFGVDALYIKHEGENPTLSFKDRGMTAGVSWARHLGITEVACASTGDTSAALAAYAAQADGMRGTVFLPYDKISRQQLAQAISYGARTLALDTDFDGCMRLVQQVCTRRSIYLLNSMNPLRIEGQKTIGLETIHQLNWQVPEWFVIPVGNAGNLSALGKGLLEAQQLGLIDRLPRIAAVQAAAADPFHRSFLGGFKERTPLVAQPTLASAIRIGDPVSHDKAARIIQRFAGVVTAVDEQELMTAKGDADRAGIAVCPNSGVALAGLRRLRATGVIGQSDRVVVIATAHGLKWSEVDYDYHTGALADLPNAEPNRPQRVAAELDAVLALLERT